MKDKLDKLREIMESKGYTVAKDDGVFEWMVRANALGRDWVKAKFGAKALGLYNKIGASAPAKVTA